jgi:exosortase E/protease (VPEID-CTERM system)
LIGRPGLGGFIGEWGSWILRGVVGFAVFFLTFSWLNHKSSILAAVHDAADSRFNLGFLAAHVIAIAVFALLSSFLYGAPFSPLNSDLLALAWLAAGLSAVVFGGFAAIGPPLWLRIVRNTGYLWIVTLAAVVLACIVGNSSRLLWPWAAGITFRMTRFLVSPFMPGLIVNPEKLQIGGPRFLGEIAPECSGLEGVGLMLAFGVAWLALFRKQCRFPQALLLLPAGAVLIFLLNSVRIAGLILIGNAGAERIAAGGFHSQAGWIIFNLVALVFTMASGSLPWLSKTGRHEPAAGTVENPTAAWLVPFLTILAAGMISRSLTSNFEWLYPLRLFSAAVALAFFRRKYASLDWHIDWFGPVTGVIVFVMWIGLDRFTSPGSNAMPAALATALPLTRNAWLASRVLAAVVTVPLAEELAFRGFLYRRLISVDFESVSLRRFSWAALLVSSVLFGTLHGSRWFSGVVAGALYALVLVRRGRIGDAVAAHATTNALIAADVLVLHHWNLW